MTTRVVGTPQEIADRIEDWIAAGVGGINVANATIPGSYEEFIAEVVPDRAQLADQFLVDGVARLRPVQRDRRHFLCEIDFQAFILCVYRQCFLPLVVKPPSG